MRRLPLILIAWLGAHSQLAAAERHREAFEYAIDNGLNYLAHGQAADGGWAIRTGKDPAVTALCVMAFMSAGHVPGEGAYGKVVEDGIKFVLNQQQSNGLIVGANQGHMEMYQHGICTLMLCEAVGMLPDRAAAARLRERLTQAVAVILKAQVRKGEDRGGWRYTMTSSDADISVTGWQLLALRAAKNIGCDVPAEPIEQAVGYIQRCHDPISGGYRYQRYGAVTIPCTGTSVLALEITTGKEHHDSTEAMKAGSLLLKNPLDHRQPHFFYGVYYTAQAMFQLGGNYWFDYRKKLHDLLLAQSPPKSGGFWVGWGSFDASIGPNYCTAMAILALTVEYRFLPIYQRSEEPNEPGDAEKKR